ncbi:MAG: hypothetical protein MR958_11155 [Spirochaetia bacterium]|nr:hypothetical protein [Spirochaetia bacterium]
MEKQRNFTESKSFKRLLTAGLFAVIFSTVLTAQALTLAQIKRLRIVPAENQKLYAKTELKFEVVLPNTPASTVQVQAPAETRDVNFKTLRKTELYSNNTDTKIELWFSFDKKGTYKLPPLSVMINGRSRSILFDEVVIENNPANMPARLVIKFNNGQTVYSDDDISKKVLFTSEAGKKLSYTIYLQHAVQLIQFNWELPKESILTQTESFEITEIKYREKNYSEELIPVASFEWVSLSEGKHPMPEIRISATGYNGYRSAILMPEFYIDFKNNTVLEEDEADALFVEAFNSNYVHSSKSEQKTISDEDCEKLAKLRTAEKRAFLNLFQARRERADFEQELELPNSQSEFPVFILHLSIAAFIIFLLLFIYYVRTNKSFQKVMIITGMICTLVLIISSSVQVSKKYAIFKQSSILSVPEENATSVNELASGTRVRILEETEEWSYIEIGETGGWVKKDRLCKI